MVLCISSLIVHVNLSANIWQNMQVHANVHKSECSLCIKSVLAFRCQLIGADQRTSRLVPVSVPQLNVTRSHACTTTILSLTSKIEKHKLKRSDLRWNYPGDAHQLDQRSARDGFSRFPVEVMTNKENEGKTEIRGKQVKKTLQCIWSNARHQFDTESN